MVSFEKKGKHFHEATIYGQGDTRDFVIYWININQWKPYDEITFQLLDKIGHKT